MGDVVLHILAACLVSQMLLFWVLFMAIIGKPSDRKIFFSLWGLGSLLITVLLVVLR